MFSSYPRQSVHEIKGIVYQGSRTLWAETNCHTTGKTKPWRTCRVVWSHSDSQLSGGRQLALRHCLRLVITLRCENKFIESRGRKYTCIPDVSKIALAVGRCGKSWYVDGSEGRDGGIIDISERYAELIFFSRVEVKLESQLIAVVCCPTLEYLPAAGSSRNHSGTNVILCNLVNARRIDDALSAQGRIGLEGWVCIQEINNSRIRPSPCRVRQRKIA